VGPDKKLGFLLNIALILIKPESLGIRKRKRNFLTLAGSILWRKEGVPIFVELVKSNIIPILGIIVHGLILIGLTAAGYKIIALVAGFKAADASDMQHLFMGIVTLGLAIGFSLIIAVSNYEPSPGTLLVTGEKIEDVRSGGGCGSNYQLK
jgi:hypothetical protein